MESISISEEDEQIIQDVISKLTFIAKLKKGERVNVQSLTLMEKGWGTSAYRTYRTVLSPKEESREVTLNFFRDITNKAFELADKYLPSGDNYFRDIGFMIVDAIEESGVGIIKHARGYKDDRMYVSRSETLARTLRTKSNRSRQSVKPASSGEHTNDPPLPTSTQVPPGRVLVAPTLSKKDPPPAPIQAPSGSIIPDPDSLLRRESGKPSKI